MPASPLRNRIALITGASAGIGEAIALELASHGAAVVLNARRKERLDELARRIEASGGRAAVAAGDAADADIIARMFETARSSFGADPDIIVVNAGRGLAGSPMTSDDAQWEDMIRTNLTGAARLIREASKRLLALADDSNWLDRPRDLVVISSNVGKHISPFSSMYGATKFALTAIAEAVRRELGPRGVRVSAIHPGIVRSEFQEVAGYDPDKFGQFMDSVGPVLEPADVARAVSFICSQPARVLVNDIVIRPTRQDYP